MDQFPTPRRAGPWGELDQLTELDELVGVRPLPGTPQLTDLTDQIFTG